MVAIAMGNVILLRAALFPLLEEDSLVMSHMDPSDIIATPFPLHKVCTFVALSLMWNLAVALICRAMTKHNNLQHDHTRDVHWKSATLHVISVLGVLTVIIHFVFILCGIHPTVFLLHTLASAFYVALNMLLPVLLLVPIHCISHKHHNSASNAVTFKLKEVNNYLFGSVLMLTNERQTQKQQNGNNRIQQHVFRCATLGTVIGMGACAILRVLDHGMQIQRYPIPTLVGATWGCCGGAIIGLALMKVIGYPP